MTTAKPFAIPKRMVWDAYLQVKAKGGAAGVDGQTIEEFERERSRNLYRIWNRMSSGTYFPPPVLQAAIPKRNGGMRMLGIPTVSDRIAQGVVKLYLEPVVEPEFHPDSYGYRPGKSAIGAVEQARERCWKYDHVVDLDIRSFFDSLDHTLVMRAVGKYTECRWVILYIERWLKADVQLEDGSRIARKSGTPQGGVISPLLANIFMHLAFDSWMQEHYRGVPFERYADDVLVHCRSRGHAEWMQARIAERLARCRLELHPDKTRIVYCKDSNRRRSAELESFDFLGFTFRPRRARNRKGGYFVSFGPAVSRVAMKSMRQTMRRSWLLHRRTDKGIADLARMVNPVIRGWINYYGSFCQSALYPALAHINDYLVRWAMRKYKWLKGHRRRAAQWLARLVERAPSLFAHWQLVRGSVSG